MTTYYSGVIKLQTKKKVITLTYYSLEVYPAYAILKISGDHPIEAISAYEVFLKREWKILEGPKEISKRTYPYILK